MSTESIQEWFYIFQNQRTILRNVTQFFKNTIHKNTLIDSFGFGSLLRKILTYNYRENYHNFQMFVSLISFNGSFMALYI